MARLDVETQLVGKSVEKSSAFFRLAGMERLYSGVMKMNPSAPSTMSLQFLVNGPSAREPVRGG